LIFCERVVELLSCNETGLLVGRLFEADIVGVYRGVGGAIAGDFVLKASDVFLRLCDSRLRACDLGLEFGNFENRDRLALANAITYIYVDVANVTGDFSMNINLLEGLKDSSDGELIRDIAEVSGNDGNRWERRGSIIGDRSITMARVEEVDEQQDGRDAASSEEEAPGAHGRPFFRADSLEGITVGRIGPDG
jgi:hypothetical protein